MKKRLYQLILLLICFNGYGQFPPPAGQDGSTAIHKDSTLFIAWASDCSIERGLMDISNASLGIVSSGNQELATGPADAQIVSLGDAGFAVLTFENPIEDGSGPDFAVFENSFSDDFLELAFVEVSSNGQQYVRFDAISLTQTETQVGSFDSLDATKIHNLAGKYRIDYGVPFDLSDLQYASGIDINKVTHVRIVDAVGSIEPEWASYDSEGRMVNEPWPTPFESGGFDLDAVGVIHQNSQSAGEYFDFGNLALWPNPASVELNVALRDLSGQYRIQVLDINGNMILEQNTGSSGGKVFISDLRPGVYFLKAILASNTYHSKFIKQ